MKYELTSGGKVTKVEVNGQKFCNTDEQGTIYKGIDGWDVRKKGVEKNATFIFLIDAINYLYNLNMAE